MTKDMERAKRQAIRTGKTVQVISEAAWRKEDDALTVWLDNERENGNDVGDGVYLGDGVYI
jgi:hypothetical protein